MTEWSELPLARWSDDEIARYKRLQSGKTVVASMRSARRGGHPNLIAWARRNGLFVCIDRQTDWGNPFIIGPDGDRDTVIDRYDNEYFPNQEKLHARLHELRQKVLGCWCAPEPCHGDTLALCADHRFQ